MKLYKACRLAQAMISSVSLMDFDYALTFSPNLKFTCSQCGKCCETVGQGISLHATDSERLGKNLRTKRVVSHPVFSGKLEAHNGRCNLYAPTSNTCSAYPVRPAICRLYPFYFGMKSDGTLLLCINHCCGVGDRKGETITQSYCEERILPLLRGDFGQLYINNLRTLVQSSKTPFLRLTGSSQASFVCNWKQRELLWIRLFEFLSEAKYQCPSQIVRSFLWELQKSCAGMADQGTIFVSSQELQTVADSAFGAVKLDKKQKGTRTFSPVSTDGFALELDYLREFVKREWMHRGLFVGPMSIESEIAAAAMIAQIIERAEPSPTEVTSGKETTGFTDCGLRDSIRHADEQSFLVARSLAGRYVAVSVEYSSTVNDDCLTGKEIALP